MLRYWAIHPAHLHFLSTATLVAANYGFACPLRCLFVWNLLFVGGTDRNCNFPAVHNPIELKLGRELGLLSQISQHVLVSRFKCFSYCKPKKKKTY
jgi:hypothetical protein